MRLLCALACVATALAACSSDHSPAPMLDGTSWRLVAIESMDDKQGSTAVPDPDNYTVSFGADGRAAFRIDCNRGSGTWEAKPSATEPSGQLSFGPIATTRMACPQPSLEQRVGTALSFVRSYLIKDGRLHLSLLADGGILTWEPTNA
jgi:heat shock protein HslJ